ncbi:hypothetical protein BD769DRAFT_1389881 [Suillus cothurnatus]|nr:hypothetical protein BD769DRAFT_1389881 [Suillus cothurnatus]
MDPRKKKVLEHSRPTKEAHEGLCFNNKPSFRPAFHLNDIQNLANGTRQSGFERLNYPLISTFVYDFASKVRWRWCHWSLGDQRTLDRRERLRKFALQTIDLVKVHTWLIQGKKHQTNLVRCAARDAEDTQLIAPTQSNVQHKVFLKIGRPGYKVTKVRDKDTGKVGLMVQVHLPRIIADVIPRRRSMSS